MACALSHVKAWQQAESEGYETAIVLEDDVWVTGDVIRVASEAMATAEHSGAAVIWLSCEDDPRLAEHQGTPQVLTVGEEEREYALRPVRKREWMSQGCRGYVITRKVTTMLHLSPHMHTAGPDHRQQELICDQTFTVALQATEIVLHELRNGMKCEHIDMLLLMLCEEPWTDLLPESIRGQVAGVASQLATSP